MYNKEDSVFEPYVRLARWYKVDIFFDWERSVYDIRLDDKPRVSNASFIAGHFSRVGLYKHHAGTVWFDELYVGPDDTMSFRSPVTKSDGIKMRRPAQYGWKLHDIGPDTDYENMTRHSSHLSRRKKYEHQNGGLLYRDGYEHRKFFSDIKTKTKDGDHEVIEGGVYAGALTYVPPQGSNTPGSKTNSEIIDITATRATTATTVDNVHARRITEDPLWDSGIGRFNDTRAYPYDNADEAADPQTGKWYWFGDHIPPKPESKEEYLQGGIFCSSTDDMINWKNEGAMLHFSNISDMVQGRPGPFIAQQPRVLYNKLTDKYVMWIQIDDFNRSLGLAGVATSNHINGPYELARTFYPDGNETHDQALFQEADGTAYLARTYYASVEYIMPQPIMQPIWESVKFPDGHTSQQSSFTFDGSVNYGLNYHRAFYHTGYDDFHDIYIQRWRQEDNKWQVVCVNNQGSQRSILIPGQYEDIQNIIYTSNVCNAKNDVINSKYIATNERKLIVGQGDVGDRGPILSRFKDPMDPANNFWKPSSVPRVKAQPWGFNYLDGTCGRRDVTQGMDRLDPELSEREIMSRRNCSNIADNPIHQTAPDKLVGIPVIVETRRAKYVAVSKLTDDYLDTSGILVAYEGELEDEADLLTIMQASGQFQWTAGSTVSSTLPKQVLDPEFKMASDWDDRFYQFMDNYNDKAWDSPSCINDGECPVNFLAQI